MSIIYEALKKTQRHLDQNRIPLSTRSINGFDIFLLIAIGCLLSLVIVSYYPKMQHYLFAKPTVPLQTKSLPPPQSVKVAPPVPAVQLNTLQAEQDYRGRMVLNGIFISEQEKVALINNLPYHVGDSVEGKKIVSIQQDKIKLTEGGQTYIWRAAT